jgi:hypothetical protein
MLKLLRTLYGLAQSAIQFWQECQMAMDAMNMAENAVNPCLFYQWVDGQLIVILLWVDNFLILGPDELVSGIKDGLLSLFNCKDVGVEMNEYVGCRDERDREAGWMRLIQPVNRIGAMAVYIRPLFGVHFYGGISPSKIGLIAPY